MKMPQKKNSALSHLPPLVFMNSPVFQPAPVLTPDLAVDHPVTAKVVPFENVIDTSWVSPQFRALDGCQSAQLNCQSLRHASIHPKQRHHKVKPEVGLKSCKFKPLQFTNCNSNEPHIEAKPASDIEACLQVCVTDDRIVGEDHLSYAGVLGNIIVHTPALVGQSDSSMCLLNGSREHNPLGIFDSASRRTIETTPTAITHRDMVQKGLMKPHNLFSESTHTDSDVSQSTEKDNCFVDIHVIKGAITSGSCLGGALNDHNNIFNCGGKDQFIRTSNSKNSSDSESHIISENPGSSPKAKAKSVILVVDTPACDYGLTFRQRQLRHKSMLNH